VFLGKGESANVRIACYVRGDAELRQLGIWKWMVEWLDAQRKLGKITDAERATRFEEFRQLSLLGLWWLLTPYRELTLLHALQQPLEAPKFVSFRSPFRFAGDTSVHIPATARVHPQTTGRLELVARWTDKVDDDPARPPRDVAREASLFPTQLSLDRNAPAVTTSPPMVKVNLADRTIEYLTPDLVALEAKIREVSAKLSESIDAFRIAAGSNQRLKDMASGARDEAAALFPLLSRPPWLELPSAARAIASLRSGLDLAGELHDPIGPLPPGIRTAANNVDNAAEALAVAAEAATAKLATAPVRHEFSDTRHRRVAYQALATARFPECFSGNAPDEAVPITRLGETNNAVILSSARPPPPVVQYVVPLFGWRTQTSAPPQVRRRRRSGGLRVYLERPWFSSGDGEVLGVVLGDNLSGGDLEKFAPFVTQWGRDPLWRTASTTNMPVPTSFTGGFDLSTNVVPAEAHAPPRVSVVQLAVDFDKDGRCFCDIMIDPAGSYWPFVRLALARFQRNSIKGLEMSRIILADFAQLAPDRTVTVTKNATDVFGVTVNGLTHESSLFPTPTNPASQKGTRIRVNAQQRIPGASDDAGWLPAGSNASVAVQVDQPNGDLLWKGAVTLPTARKPGQFRILVEELEKHRSLNPDKSSPEFPVVDRVVFAETVEI
jgi:hypothetical protein